MTTLATSQMLLDDVLINHHALSLAKLMDSRYGTADSLQALGKTEDHYKLSYDRMMQRLIELHAKTTRKDDQ